MANTKTYTVVKDGEELKTLKTLAAAKKLADGEGAVVVCDGEEIYSPIIAPTTDEDVAPAKEEAFNPVDETVIEQSAEPEAPETPTTKKFVLTAKMNICKAPSTTAPKLGVAVPGTAVEAVLEDDWLHLTDGTFILCQGGKFAKEN